MWKISWSTRAWTALEFWTDHGLRLDTMGFAYGMFVTECGKADANERKLLQLMGQSSVLTLPPVLFELIARGHGASGAEPKFLPQVTSTYRKIGQLCEFIEGAVCPGDVESFLHAIESFGSGVGNWLKVAADSKALVVEGGMRKRRASRCEAAVEFGTFVGYTAIRLARWTCGPPPAPGWCVSLEIDPIHAFMTKHQLSLAHLSTNSDVWVGQALNLVPRLPEELGQSSCCYVFMDHRGTKFHSDLARLQAHAAVPRQGTHVADNVLKPGAPAHLWHITWNVTGVAAAFWSLNEFAHWNSEDWMLLCDL